MLLPVKSTIINVAGLSTKPLSKIQFLLPFCLGYQGSDVYSYDLKKIFYSTNEVFSQNEVFGQN